MGGKSKKKTTTTYTPPSWVEAGSRQAVDIGRRIGSQQFRSYEGERVAGLSESEQRGIDLAQSTVGIAQPYIDEAADYTRRGTQSWTDADQSAYINPYIKGALDPAAREIREQGQRDVETLAGRSAMMSAFGGSRAALAQQEARTQTLEQISDLYGEGYARAYESGVALFGEERARDMEAAGRFQQLGGEAVAARDADVSTLMTTGATDRGIQQAMLDFDWQQFVEERDWGFRQLMGVVAALEGTKGSYGYTQTSKTEVKKDSTAEVVGAIAQVVAAAYGASDERLKENIIHLGNGIYTWTWNAIARLLGYDIYPTIGVIAQEHPEHCIVDSNGFLMVNYRSLFGGDSW